MPGSPRREPCKNFTESSIWVDNGFFNCNCLVRRDRPEYGPEAKYCFNGHQSIPCKRQPISEESIRSKAIDDSQACRGMALQMANSTGYALPDTQTKGKNC